MKRILMAMGAATFVMLAAGIAGLGYIGANAFVAADKNVSTAIASVKQVSKNWAVDGTENVVHAGFIQVLQKPDGMAFLRNMSRLGALKEAKDATQVHFGMSTEKGTEATIEFNGIFTNGTAKIIAKLVKADGKMKLFGIQIKDGKLKPKKAGVAA